MDPIYIVIENGDAYPDAYESYHAAVTSVIEKYADEVEQELQNGEYSCWSIPVQEDNQGTTYLYIEKGIHIYIHRFYLPARGPVKLVGAAGIYNK
jgi:hypothetical protein